MLLFTRMWERPPRTVFEASDAVDELHRHKLVVLHPHLHCCQHTPVVLRTHNTALRPFIIHWFIPPNNSFVLCAWWRHSLKSDNKMRNGDAGLNCKCSPLKVQGGGSSLKKWKCYMHWFSLYCANIPCNVQPIMSKLETRWGICRTKVSSDTCVNLLQRQFS